MCPCVLLDKLKNAMGIGKKKKKKNKNKKSADSDASSASKKGGKGKNANRSGKGSKKADSSQTGSALSSEPSKTNVNAENQVKVELLGQVVHNKPNPAKFVQRVLQSERPDLVDANGKLEEKEVATLDEYLLKKGEMRNGIDITLGKVTDCDSSLMVGEGEDVMVVMLYAHGRFGAIYLVHREANSEQERNGLGNGMALKTSRRMYASARTEKEIEILLHLCNTDRTGKLKGIPLPTHITPIFFHGTAGGTPYLIMPMMDANLEKIRQEIGYQMPWCDAFYIGQEVLLGLKQCHEHSVVHRDVKPTNVLLPIKNNRNWWLCDFGDACRIGEKTTLGCPDAITLPFVSRSGHQAVKEPVTATIWMDLESWFYLLLDLFMPLPWKPLIEEDETLAAKNSFWTSIDDFFTKNESKLPPSLLQIGKLVSVETSEKPYSQLTAILRDGFNKYNEKPPWTPVWIKKRPVPVQKASERMPVSTEKKAKKPTKKKLGKINSKNKDKDSKNKSGSDIKSVSKSEDSKSKTEKI